MDNKEIKNQEGLSLFDFWQLLRGNILFFLSTTLLFFATATIYAWFIATPQYISNADVMVQVEQGASTTSDPNFDLVNAFRLIDTIAELMEKEIILNNAISTLEEMGYENFDLNYLRGGLDVTSSATSYFINITFTDKNPLFAKDVVDSVITAVIEETNIKDAFPVLTDKIRRTSFASEGIYNSPNRFLFSLIGTLIGVISSSAIIFLRDLLSNQFKNKEEIEQLLKVQVLGVIPLMNYKEIRNDKKK
jgi:capsular polysaccharide biosynthesis protein